MSIYFPEGFIFGAATSSYQIEGNHKADGSGENIWTEFCKNKGTILKNHNGDIACNHYNLYKDDIRLMKDMGLDSYRFSVSWARIFPDGFGKPNQKGIDFYNNLVDELLQNGILPFATLYHWDLPQSLQLKGGWANDDIYKHFAEFATVMTKNLGDRVPHWVTLNEPWVFMHLGHISGEHAPGIKNVDIAAKAYKNIVLAHSNAAMAMRTYAPNSEIGICCNYTIYEPGSDSEADIKATKRYSDYQNLIFSDAWILNKIPKIAEDAFGISNESLTDEELTILKADTPDFIGLNYYTRNFVEHCSDEFLQAKVSSRGNLRTAMGWEVYPDGIRQVLHLVNYRYNLPVIVTENGCACNASKDDSEIDIFDKNRVFYLDEHLRSCKKAIIEGVDLRGYYAWSLLDNFEWAFGYTQRFGFIHVDFETQKRTLKKSAERYSHIIRENEIMHQNSPSKHKSIVAP